MLTYLKGCGNRKPRRRYLALLNNIETGKVFKEKVKLYGSAITAATFTLGKRLRRYALYVPIQKHTSIVHKTILIVKIAT